MDIIKNRKINIKYKIVPMEGTVEEALNKLDPREKQVIQMRLGIGKYNKSYSFEEIGKNIENKIHIERNVNKERVRQIESKALRKLKHPIRNCKIIYFNNEQSETKMNDDIIKPDEVIIITNEQENYYFRMPELEIGQSVTIKNLSDNKAEVSIDGFTINIKLKEGNK